MNLMQGSAQRLRRLLRHEGQSLLGQRNGRLFWFWLPLVLCVLMTWLLQATTPSALPLLVVDADQSADSRALIRTLEASPELRIETVAAYNLDPEPALRRGDAIGVLYLPSGLEANRLTMDSTQLRLHLNTQLANHSGQVQRAVSQAVAAQSQDLLQYWLTMGTDAAWADQLAVPVSVESLPLLNPGVDNRRFLLVPLTLAMLQIMIMVGTVSLFGRELRDSTVPAWIDRAGGLGRALAVRVTVLAALILSWGGALWIGWRAVGILSGTDAGFLASYLLLAGASAGIGLLLLALTLNMRLALSLTAFLAAPAFAFAGQAFPLVAMPPFAQFWSQLLPLTHWLPLYHHQLAGTDLISHASGLTLLAIGLTTGALGLLLLLRRMNNPAVWGQQ